MPYRAELKRPDLKGQFPCSVCGKIFCHSSSLSRHRMQAHFKSYTCTLCSQEISSNETLRSHMFRSHQISRMFMCRCCNWAFPDKTSLHIHMQSMMRNGSPGDVHILAKSSADGGSPGFMSQLSPSSSPICKSPQTPTVPSIFPVMPNREELLNRFKQRQSPVIPERTPEAQSLLATWLANNFANPWAAAANNSNESRMSDECPLDGIEIRMDESDIKEEIEEGQLVIAEEPDTITKLEPADSIDDETLPVLRSAISANPLNSLMYRKKLNNALRNKSHNEPSLANFFYSPVKMEEEPKLIDSHSHVINQPSPTGSDSQTSSSGAPLSAASDGSSPHKCFECQVLKGKLGLSENRNRFLESKVSSLESKVCRMEQQISGLESSGRRYESEHKVLRDQCEVLERKLLSCQEKALRYMQNGPNDDQSTMKQLLEDLLQTTSLFQNSNGL